MMKQNIRYGDCQHSDVLQALLTDYTGAKNTALYEVGPA
jgi:hypothetical protein